MASDLSQRKYIRYDPGLNTVAPGEAENIEAIKKIFNGVIRGDNKIHGHTYPTTHARTLGVVKGKLTVPNDLPQHLKQGPLKSGDYPVVMRYSFNNHDNTADAITSRSRGITLKVFNLPGDRFPEGAGNTTQDFTMNSTLAVAELADAQTAREIIEILEQGLTDKAGAGKAIFARKDRPLQLAPSQQTRRRVEALDYFGQFAYRFGDYVAKYNLVAVSEPQKALAKQELPADKGTIDDLTNWIKEYYAANEAKYELRFQLLENLDQQPVEYAGTEWPQDKYPYQTVGTITFPKQDSADQELFKFWVDSLRINVWRGLKTLEPMGGSNRVRRQMYGWSKDLRATLNPSTLVDVQSIDQLPGAKV